MCYFLFAITTTLATAKDSLPKTQNTTKRHDLPPYNRIELNTNHLAHHHILSL